MTITTVLRSLPWVLLAACAGADEAPTGGRPADSDTGPVSPNDSAGSADTAPTGRPTADTGPELPACTPAPGTVHAPGTPLFRDATADWGLDQVLGIRFNAVDIDGDGWVDLAIRTGNEGDDLAAGVQRAWLLRNTGAGGFEDITAVSGVRARRDGGPTGRPGGVWVWADVDNDGDLDLYSGLPDDGSTEVERSELLLNDGQGRFALGPDDHRLGIGIDNPYGAAFTDVDRDGRVDLWTTHAYGASGPLKDRLFINLGDGRFDDRARTLGVATEAWDSTTLLDEARGHSNAWAAAACDLTGDGAPELLTSSYGRAANHLWRNDGTGSYTNHSLESGYAWDDRTDWSDNESARCWCQHHPDDDDCAGVPDPQYIACSSDADAFRWRHGSDRQPHRLGGNSGQTTCADVDNDGDMDLLTSEIVHWDVGSSSDPSELLLNDGRGVFTRPGNELTGLQRSYDRTEGAVRLVAS